MRLCHRCFGYFHDDRVYTIGCNCVATSSFLFDVWAFTCVNPGKLLHASKQYIANK